MLVDYRVGRAGEIVRDELVWTLVFINQRCLPGKKIGGEPLRIALPFELPSGIDDACLRGNFGPVIQPLSPVVQSPDLIQLIDSLEFLLEILNEASLHV